jgi:hypothetical protein
MAPILFLVPCSCFSLHFNCCTSFPTFASGSLCFLSLFFLELLQVGCHGSLKKKFNSNIMFSFFLELLFLLFLSFFFKLLQVKVFLF